ncbi:hypothetical protein L228DRAFT_238322 [Xylona heveae TC161]|uniref:Mitochondrial export translocase Oxa2 n=1 Tax=Xylona heveae (strain CBS 132557 / TC161) TaxID=1328760 RepID=A0A165HPL0_XYLHT|nr:hypothetical protein L228DRAFT_238322 [Xylona heveae TC161]KZF23804.1 hypothetical protein L228DRAFT_238322 [Xylona heveae TC161]
MSTLRGISSKSFRLQRISYSTPLRPSCRSFHSSRPKQFIEPAIAQTHLILETIHTATGLPWVAAIPLTALAIRAAVVLPLSIWGRKSAQKRLELQPLVNAWQRQIVRRGVKGLNTPDRELSILAMKVAKLPDPVGHPRSQEVMKSLQYVVRGGIYKRWGCRWYASFAPILQLPVFLLVIETLRKMCGTHEGLLGLLSKPFLMASEALKSIDAGRSDVLDALATSHANIPLETSMSYEGALWFPDLIASDPMLVLPFMLSGVMFANISSASRGGARGVERTKRQRWLTNTLKLMALAVGPATLQMPSALLIYWISSSAFGLVQSFLLDKFMPLRLPVKPLKPPQNISLQGKPNDNQNGKR